MQFCILFCAFLCLRFSSGYKLFRPRCFVLARRNVMKKTIKYDHMRMLFEISAASSSSINDDNASIQSRRRNRFDNIVKLLLLFNELETTDNEEAVTAIVETPAADYLELCHLKDHQEKEGARNYSSVGDSQFLVSGIDEFARKKAFADRLSMRVSPVATFVVPSEFPWPQENWGTKLGSVVHDIRRKKSFCGERCFDVLNSYGFMWSNFDKKFIFTIQALEIYRELYKDKKIPSKFQVPVKSVKRKSATSFTPTESKEDLEPFLKQQEEEDDDDDGDEGDNTLHYSTWPVHLQGFNLGYAVSTIVEHVKTVRKLSPDNIDNNEMTRLLHINGVLLDEKDISADKRRKIREENEAMMRNVYGTRNRAVTALDKNIDFKLEGTDKNEKKVGSLDMHKNVNGEKRRVRGGGRPPISRLVKEDIEPITLGAAAKIARQKEISERGVIDSNMKTQFESAARQGQFSKFFVPKNCLSLMHIRFLLETDKSRQRLIERVRRFDILLQGLTVFRGIFAHYRVPVSFVVPVSTQNNDNKYSNKTIISPTTQLDREIKTTTIKWPKHLHGYPLGADLSKLQNELQQLEEQNNHQKIQRNLTTKNETNAGHQNIDDVNTNSNKDVVDTYIVEHKSVWGQDETIATRTAAANEQWLYYKKDALLSLGISLSRRRSLNFELILKALRTHDTLFGDVLVPRYFIVPSEYPWDIDCWGMPLGNKVRNIRYRGAYGSTEQRRALRELGIKFTYVKEGEIVYGGDEKNE